jgi:3-phenylpropionate/trans-cinnamate dioxygenase ferredoxin subunit
MTSKVFFRAAMASDLPHGAKQAVEVNGKPILLCNWNGQIFAVSNLCSHAEERLECGRMSNGWIACPVHGARFDLATGRAKNPPAKQPIAVYGIRIADGWIEVET